MTTLTEKQAHFILPSIDDGKKRYASFSHGSACYDFICTVAATKHSK